MMCIDTLSLPHGELPLPAFLPDATLGVVRSVDSADLEVCGIHAVVMNTFHLMQRPGSSSISALGGLHKMAGWPHPIITDSGGFQAYSLIRENPKMGSLGERGIVFHPEGSERKLQLTPEKSVQLQLSYGADVVICLDDCTHVDAPYEVQAEAVRRTVAWAKRGKAEFERTLGQKSRRSAARPQLWGVIQGGGYRELRRQCAEELLALGFDGFGYGGWPLDSDGRLLTDILAYTRELVPPELPMHALGIGHPDYVRQCVALGYTLFDSALPTRDARHARLYVLQDEAVSFLYIGDQKHIKADAPVDPGCTGLCCQRYSRGYLHHLFKIGDAAFLRLATLHNLCTMTRLMEGLGARHG
jgi:queuine tRNA-ribosyltransferase